MAWRRKRGFGRRSWYLVPTCSDCDVAVIVSNDSDLVFPIEHIKKHLGKVIGILNPHPQPSRELLPLANFYKSMP